MRTRALVAVGAALLLSGCYRVTVTTGAPSATQKIDKLWQNSFVYGLVPPPEVDAKDPCQSSVATVQTERSFLNSLVAALTLSIFTPMHTTVTCASGR